MKIIALLLIVISFSQASVANKIPIANFSLQDLSHWENKVFNNASKYTLVKDEGTFVLKAETNNSASGKFKKQTINLKKTPYLNWRWKINNRLNTSNEKTKQNDDFSARIYVIKSGGLFFWKTLSLNYVWSNQHSINTSWPNPYAPDNAIMLAVRSKTDNTNTWYSEKRNVYKDLQNTFGKSINQIDGIAIMSDSDDSKGKATAYFGDIYFSKN